MVIFVYICICKVCALILSLVKHRPFISKNCCMLLPLAHIYIDYYWLFIGVVQLFLIHSDLLYMYKSWFLLILSPELGWTSFIISSIDVVAL